MPSPTRRQFVAGGAALAVGGYGGYRLFRGRADADFADWEPESGTWPLPRYDPAHTAHNPHANPPRKAPTRRHLTTAETWVRPIVGKSRIVLYGDTLATVSRDGGTPTKLSHAYTRYPGIDPTGRLHTVLGIGYSERRFDLVGYDGTTEAYRVPLDGVDPRGLTIGADEVFVGTRSRDLFAIHPDGRDWTVDGALPALADGHLYAAGASDGVVSYAERRGLDRAVTAGPRRVWTGPAASGIETHAPAVADGRLVVGTLGGPGRSGEVAAYDADTGSQLWEPRGLGGLSVATPAVVGSRGYAAVWPHGNQSGRVVALDLETGETLWADEVAWGPYAPAVGGDTLVVAGEVKAAGEEPDGKIRAYDRATGEELWTITLEPPSGEQVGIALVGERMYASYGKDLYELS